MSPMPALGGRAIRATFAGISGDPPAAMDNLRWRPWVLRGNYAEPMARYGAQFGPDITFLGVDAADLDEPATYRDADVVILGAPFDGGTSYRSGARFGPKALRETCYLATTVHGRRWPCGWTGCRDLRVVDVGDVEMYSGDAARSCADLEAAVEKVAATGAIR